MCTLSLGISSQYLAHVALDNLVAFLVHFNSMQTHAHSHTPHRTTQRRGRHWGCPCANRSGSGQRVWRPGPARPGWGSLPPPQPLPGVHAVPAAPQAIAGHQAQALGVQALMQCFHGAGLLSSCLFSLAPRRFVAVRAFAHTLHCPTCPSMFEALRWNSSILLALPHREHRLCVLCSFMLIRAKYLQNEPPR
jgi:hypothetical protein